MLRLLLYSVLLASLIAFSVIVLGCSARSSGAGAMPPPSPGSEGAEPAEPSGVVTSHGATFRLWAPHANAVSVVGDFNGWDASATPMTQMLGSGTAGWFGADVADAKAGQRYRFVLLDGGSTMQRADPRGRAMDDVKGASILVDPSAYAWQTSFVAPPPEQRIVYELHLGTFNPPGGVVPGGFRDAMAKLDWLAALGITVVELMPPAEFPGTRSWGYNPAQPFAVEESYGAPDDVRAFIDAAHARGIAVVIDVVHNHYDSSVLRCFDGDCLGADGVYFYADARRNTPWGPRPDFGRGEIRSYVVDNARMWIDEYRADGFRWDSVLNIRQVNGQDNPDGIALVRAASDAVHQKGGIQIAEDLQNYDAITRSTADGGFGFDAQWDAAFFHPVDDTIINASDAARSMPAIAGAVTHNYGGRALARVIYTEDHDEVANGKERIPEMITPGDAGSYYARKRSTLGAALVFTSPGTPMIFMGQEFLENGYFADTHPLDWTKTTRYAGIVALYRDLIRLRKNGDGNTRGLTGEHVDAFHVNDDAKVIAFRRWAAGGHGDDTIVLANFSNRAFASYEIGLPSGGTWHVRFNSDATAYSPDFDGSSSADVVAAATPRDGQPNSGLFALGRYSVLILSQDP